MAFLRLIKWLLVTALMLVGAVALVLALTHRTPADLPLGRIDLGRAQGPLTRTRIAALANRPAACRAVLAQAGVAIRPLPIRADTPDCGYADAIAWAPGGARESAYAPARPALACPLAAGLTLWEWDVVQPAAARAYGTTVIGIDTLGSYACRRIEGRATGVFSQHARAAAIDVAGFRLADGRRITVQQGWRGPDAAFLHAVRDGACRIFATTLSPDFDAAHHDHLHLDEAARGGFGVCR